MKTVLKRDNETKKEYLLRAAVTMLYDNAYLCEVMGFDESEFSNIEGGCSSDWLAGQIENEFNVNLEGD